MLVPCETVIDIQLTKHNFGLKIIATDFDIFPLHDLLQYWSNDEFSASIFYTPQPEHFSKKQEDESMKHFFWVICTHNGWAKKQQDIEKPKQIS